MSVEGGNLQLTFGTDPAAAPEIGCPAEHIPHTTVHWDEVRAAQVLTLHGTAATAGVLETSADLTAGSIAGVEIRHVGGATEVAVRLEAPMDYVARYTFGNEPTLTIDWSD